MSEPTSGNTLDDLYRAPQNRLASPTEPSERSPGEGAESELSERNRYRQVEASLRVIGGIFILTPVFGLLNIASTYSATEIVTITPGDALVILFSSAFVVWFGLGLRNLRNWARWLGVVALILAFLRSIGHLRELIDPAVGFTPDLRYLTRIGGSIFIATQFFLLFLPGASHVCTSHYRRVIAETRYVRPTLGLRDRILLGLFLVDSIAGVVGRMV